MAEYSAEPIHINDIQSFFECNWDSKNCCEIPVPLFATTDIVRFDPSEQWCPANPRRAFVNIKSEELVERQIGYAYEHVRQELPLTIDIWTQRSTACAGGTDRQHLHDVKQELRRIIYTNKYGLGNWQIIRYGGFREIFEDSVSGRFHGQLRLTLENEGVMVPSTLLDSDNFNRCALGCEWSNLTGVWGITSNQLDPPGS